MVYNVALVSKKTPVKFVGKGDVGDVVVGVVSVGSVVGSSLGGKRVDVLRRTCGGCLGLGVQNESVRQHLEPSP